MFVDKRLSVSFGGPSASGRWETQMWSIPSLSSSKINLEIHVSVSGCDLVMHMIEILR